MTFMILKMIGCLALLMFGMKTMSEGLQKLTGGHLRAVLGTMTKHRVGGLLTGMFVTTSVQSSTATTVMTVSFVNAGLLTLSQAIPVIMGANIGTTATAWIMSIFGFQFNMSSVVWPFFALGIILSYTKKSSTKSFGEFVFGFSFMFLGLCTLRENAVAMDLSHNEAVINFFKSCGGWGIWTTLLFLVLGSVLTMCVQSSAAIMAITLILCSSGVLPIYQGIALVMGENIGTTVTSNLAALSASTQARRAALAHMLFNVFGVIWVLIVFHPFVNMVCHIVGFDPTFVPQTEEEIAQAGVRVTYALSGFHTAFNVCNVLILIWFVKLMEKVICKIIQGKKDEDEDFRLKFISSGLLSTAELSLFEARKEINLFATRSKKMFGFVPQLLELKDENEFTKLFARIEKYEGISDNMEIEIANYLNKVSEGRLSPESKANVQSMLREISEIESIGDACYNMARAINHKFRSKEDFTEEQYAHIKHIMELCDRAMAHMLNVIEDKGADANHALNLENEINDYRQLLKKKNVDDIDAKLYSYQMSVHYMDIVNDCEKLGDYIINVVEAHAHVRLTY
ncbi:Na/Pi cotransporter family protein [Fibrobacter sp.]|uniref:Na/Pi cotransporter family protein n=1 Tax=Fibrobacter sp. TaxID=35828 RepID=UPI00388DD6E1